MTSCILCNSTNLVKIGQIPHAVTSDAKIYPHPVDMYLCICCEHVQKSVDAELSIKLENIYKTYSVNFSENIQEQMLFENGCAVPRSKVMAQAIIDSLKLADAGRLLDFGCGNGNFLSQCSMLMPQWSLSGFDILQQFKDKILSIANVDAFYSDITSINKRFDLITLHDVFEHISNPVEVISQLVKLLATNGKIFIKSPYFLNNFFDLAIIDHYSHFTLKTLSKTFHNMNARLYIDRKNITAIIEHDNIFTDNILIENNIESAAINSIKKLNDINDNIKNISTEIVIYGTSVVATYIAGICQEKVKFFIDDDVLRQGNKHLGIPIIALDKAAQNIPIILAFPQEQATKVYESAIHRCPNLLYHFVY